MCKNSRKKQDNQVVYSLVKENGNSLYLEGKCGDYEFEINLSFELFPSEKAIDNAYRVWIDTFMEAVIRNNGKTKNHQEKKETEDE